jgi:large subunit ribosomal protein L21e
MVQRTGGFRRKTRSKLRKNVREKGKISIKKFLQSFNEGDKVGFKAEPAVQRGMYHPRFHGKTGTITGKKGGCYEVEIRDGSKQKTLVVHPIHLRRL